LCWPRRSASTARLTSGRRILPVRGPAVKYS
jgi:hypothetical protein